MHVYGLPASKIVADNHLHDSVNCLGTTSNPQATRLGYIWQGEYLRLQSQDESDSSASIDTVRATLKFYTPSVKLTGNLPDR